MGGWGKIHNEWVHTFSVRQMSWPLNKDAMSRNVGLTNFRRVHKRVSNQTRIRGETSSCS